MKILIKISELENSKKKRKLKKFIAKNLNLFKEL